MSVRVITNSFEITRLPSRSFFQYEVQIVPETKSRQGHDIIERLQNHTAPEIFTPRCVYDGKAILYSPRKLNLAGGASGAFNVYMGSRPPPQTESNEKIRGMYSVRLVSVAGTDIDFGALNAFITGSLRQQTPQVLVAINLLQFLVRQAPNLKFPHNARAFYTPSNSQSIGGGLELWRGYFQSVRPTEKRMVVNVDISTSAMYKSGPFIDVALDVIGGGNDIRRLSLSETDITFRKLKSFFKRVFVTLNHLKREHPVRKEIRGIVARAGRITFEKREPDGHLTELTVDQYYRQTYNRPLQYPDIIGIEVGNKSKSIIIPAEFCAVMPGQLFKRKVPPELTKAMVQFSTKKPMERLNTIASGVASPVLDYANSDFINTADMVISSKALMIEGRVLQTPVISYGDNHTVNPRDGSWNLARTKFFAPADIVAWGVVDYSLDRRGAEQRGENFVRGLMDALRSLGMNVADPGCLKSGAGASSVNNDLLEAGTAAMRSTAVHSLPPEKQPRQPQLLVVILPSAGHEVIRAAVKRFGDVERGVPTQCVREDKLRKANIQYYCNVGLKINARLGGDNSIPRFADRNSSLSILQSSPFMIMGADVGHPGPGVNQPSVASLVYSYDRYGVRYAALSSVQQARQENIAELQGMVEEALERFGKRHKAAPQKIVFYRDGLSEGEYEQVGQNEIGEIESAITAVFTRRKVPGPRPQLTFIVVGKRHHVRFFPLQPNEGDRTGNCKAGFVADKGIGNPVARDFYLQSHGGLLGTSRPSHYILLRDDIYKENVKALQELSFALCHAFARATRSVSIPAPVYYADIVCSRAAFHFDPRLHYEASLTDSDGGSFHFEQWKQGYKPVNKSEEMTESMYFI